MYGITQVVSSANDAYRSQFNMPYMCMCIYAYMYVYMYSLQYNESTEVQTLGTVIYDAQK